jgi:hypothetical protein
MRKILGCLVLASVAGGMAAASDERWIHVRVDDNGGAKGHVDIQVPIELVSTLLPVLKGAGSRGGIHIDGNTTDLAELRGYWGALKSAKDGDYVTVRDADSDVRVAKRGGYFTVAVDDKGGKSRVRMKIPLPLVDAVLAGGDTLDVDALGTALAQAPVGELVTVDDDDSHVRIWIDREAAPPREDRP